MERESDRLWEGPGERRAEGWCNERQAPSEVKDWGNQQYAEKWLLGLEET